MQCMFELLPALTVGATTAMVSMNAFGIPTTSTDAFENHFSSKDCRDGRWSSYRWSFSGCFWGDLFLEWSLKNLLFSQSIGKYVEHFPFVIMKPINFPWNTVDSPPQRKAGPPPNRGGLGRWSRRFVFFFTFSLKRPFSGSILVFGGKVGPWKAGESICQKTQETTMAVLRNLANHGKFSDSSYSKTKVMKYKYKGWSLSCYEVFIKVIRLPEKFTLNVYFSNSLEQCLAKHITFVCYVGEGLSPV